MKLSDLPESELSALMITFAHTLQTAAKKLDIEKLYFCLLVFDKPYNTQYIANCEREGCVDALHELLFRLEMKKDNDASR